MILGALVTIVIIFLTFIFLIMIIAKVFGLKQLSSTIWIPIRKNRWVLAAILLTTVISIMAFTGPRNTILYPNQADSPYSLPWKMGLKWCVIQGNRSISTHRSFYEYSWDFWMPIGSEILSARNGIVSTVIDKNDGFSIRSNNYLEIEHEDGTKAVYAHIKKDGIVVELGEKVIQGQLVAYSGMVGYTIFPHLHFHVVANDGKASIPISFHEVQGGIPLAGNCYSSRATTF